MKTITGYNAQVFINHKLVGEVKPPAEYESPKCTFVGGSIEFRRSFGRHLRKWQKGLIGYYAKTKSKQPRSVFVRKLKQERHQ